ncbi:hemocyte protein-glutamine gamma-glutamyltransferase-like protein, partial [Dinothrombium tinctorium]
SERAKLHVKLPYLKNHGFKLRTQAFGNKINFDLHIPYTSPIGFWSLHFKYHSISELLSDNLLILFNPWSEYDTVYMSNQKLLEENVLNENGISYYGTALNYKPNDWHYSQFKSTIIEAMKLVFTMVELKTEDWKDPVMVSRALAKITSYDSHAGILIGQWEEPYESYDPEFEAHEPSYWDGSAEILETFVKQKGYPVQFAQCWVFASVLTTMLRFLGIPSRPVSNFESGADFYPNDLEITQFINETLNKENVWTFHVWTEAWMQRRDLSFNGSFDGWQICDGTYGIGPAPRIAIRNAKLNIKKYQKAAQIFYSEVNADFVMKDTKGNILERDISRVGKLIATKAADSDYDMEELTYEYKEIEGSVKERINYKEASRYVKRRTTRARSGPVRVGETRTMEVKIIYPQRVYVGKNLETTIQLKNNLPIRQTYTIKINAYSQYYNGQNAHYLKWCEKGLRKCGEIPSLRDYSWNITLTPKDYLPKLVPFNIIRFSAYVLNKKDNPIIEDSQSFMFDMPQLEVSRNNEIVTKSRRKRRSLDEDSSYEVKATTVKVKIDFQNPLNISLTHCMLKIQGTRINVHTKKLDDFGPLETRSIDYDVAFNEVSKNEMIVAQLFSRELDKISGKVQIY